MAGGSSHSLPCSYCITLHTTYSLPPSHLAHSHAALPRSTTTRLTEVTCMRLITTDASVKSFCGDKAGGWAAGGQVQ